MTPICTLFIYK